jgi:hypothetical protein
LLPAGFTARFTSQPTISQGSQMQNRANIINPGRWDQERWGVGCADLGGGGLPLGDATGGGHGGSIARDAFAPRRDDRDALTTKLVDAGGEAVHAQRRRASASVTGSPLNRAAATAWRRLHARYMAWKAS